MIVFFSYSTPGKTFLHEIEVATGTTVEQLLDLKKIKKLTSIISPRFKVGVNSEILDGEFKPIPKKYRLKEGERVEIYRELTQDPKERRRKNI